MFKKLMNLALVALGITEFPTKDGKVNFSEEQKSTLEKELAGQMGPDFVAQLEAAINKHMEDTSAKEESEAAKQLVESVKAESLKEIKTLSEKLSALEKKQQASEKSQKEAEEKIAKLSKDPEEEPGSINPAETKGKVVKFKPNMKHRHNARANGYLTGQENLEVAATTIDVSEMHSEFGDFMSQFDIKLEVIKKLTQRTVSETYMTTKMAVESWKASAALITSVVQQFVAKWTPLGQSTFTPLTIQNYRHKINVPITPNEIMDSWLGYLYDEGTTPDAMPITKYIIEQLIVPKVLEDRELRLIGKGSYQALGAVTEGDPGQATGKSMNGFCTILKNEKASGTSAVSFINLATITDSNIVEQVNKFVDAIDDVYQDVPMNVHCSREFYRKYKRAYKKLWGGESGDPSFGQDMIDYSQNRLVPLPSMAGEDLIFATPKENFIRLQHKNAGASSITMQLNRYDVEVFAEWWEGVGFAIAEAVFAYVPETSGSGS